MYICLPIPPFILISPGIHIGSAINSGSSSDSNNQDLSLTGIPSNAHVSLFDFFHFFFILGAHSDSSLKYGNNGSRNRGSNTPIITTRAIISTAPHPGVPVGNACRCGASGRHGRHSFDETRQTVLGRRSVPLEEG